MSCLQQVPWYSKKVSGVGGSIASQLPDQEPASCLIGGSIASQLPASPGLGFWGEPPAAEVRAPPHRALRGHSTFYGTQLNVFVRSKAHAIEQDVQKLRIVHDPKIHYDLLRVCQHTRIAFLSPETCLLTP